MNLVIIEAFADLFFNSAISSAGGAIAFTIDGNSKSRQWHKVCVIGGYIDFGELQSNAKDIGAVDQWADEIEGCCIISRQNDIRV